MKRHLLPLLLVAALLLPAVAFAQKNVIGGTGKVQFKLNRAGTMALYDKDGLTHLNRASLVVALSKDAVFDYEQDAMYLTASPILSVVGKADTVATAMYDNTWNAPPFPPDVQVMQNVYAYKNDGFVLSDYRVTNTGAAATTVSIGIGCVPYPSETWGGETVEYDATKKIAYFYRVGETPYVGVKVMGQDPTSFHVLDWDVYSSDPSADAATDSTRYVMTTAAGFDNALIGGVDGTFFNLNFGSQLIGVRSSVTMTVAYLYGTSLNELRAQADSAEARYALLLAASNVKNVYGGTGKVQFKLNRAGSLTMYDETGLTHLDRASLVVGLDSANVFDYEQDAMYLMTSSALSTGTAGAADTIASTIFDNTWNEPPYPPNVRVWATVRAYKNDPFVLTDYVITNYNATASTLNIGMGCVPYPSETWGGETVEYDAVKKMAYFFRVGETPYVGVKVMGQDPTSFHVLDWDVYSSDPAADASTDSIRWLMTAKPGFDNALIGGVDGSFFNLNFGSIALDGWSSATYTVAYLYAGSLSALQAAADAAVARFSGVNAVSPAAATVPEQTSLSQNYPNPFNPSTVVSFQLATASTVRLAVYDILGREVATLVNEQMTPGQHNVTWNAAGMASGVYFYRLTAGSFSQAKQMVLMK